MGDQLAIDQLSINCIKSQHMHPYWWLTSALSKASSPSLKHMQAVAWNRKVMLHLRQLVTAEHPKVWPVTQRKRLGSKTIKI